MGGLQCLIEDGVQGYIVAPGSVFELKEKISYLLDRPELREKMGRAGRKRIEDNYTWDAVYERYYAHLFT